MRGEVAMTAGVPIAVRALAKAYGKVRALDGVDLDVKSGEFLTLLGPSGSGKTTLLMALAGFIRPDQGSIRFGEQEVVRLAPHKRDVGMVFQNYALFPHLDVAANIAFPLKLRRVPAADIARRVEAVLERVRLAGLGARRVSELSGGQRQRVALARAIVFEPRVVLMDEPLSALDKQLREHMQIELRQLHDTLGTTTIYVTHDQREALTLSDRVAVFSNGRVMQVDAPRALYERPATRFVAEFVGESSFLPVEWDGGTCRCGGVAVQVATAPPVGRRGLVMLRPERVYVCGAADGPNGSQGANAASGRRGANGAGDDRFNLLDARVTHVVYQGDTMLVQALLTGGHRIAARGVASDARLSQVRVGDMASFGFAAKDAVVVDDVS